MRRRRRRRQGAGVPGALIVVQNLSVPLDRRVWQECQALVDAGYLVSVICPAAAGDPPARQLDGVWIHTYPPPPAASGLLGFVWEFAYCWIRTAVLSCVVWRRRGFDVLQACNPPDTYWLLARLWRLRGVRFVFDQHDLCPEVYEARFGRSGPAHSALLLLERVTYRTADATISTNESYRAVAMKRGGLALDAVTIVRSAPDPAKMRRIAPVDELRDGRRHLVCYLGIMGPQDGVDRLLNVIDIMVHRLGRDDCHFGLLGFGDCLADLQEDAQRRGLGPWITFTGRADLPMIADWLSTADLGVTPDPPTRFNDLSTMNKTLEYMAYGLPVVHFDLTETRRSAGPAGFVVLQNDDTAMAEAIVGLLDDPERRAAMGAEGRRRIEQHLSWAAQAEAYVGVFDAVHGREPGSKSLAASSDLVS